MISIVLFRETAVYECAILVRECHAMSYWKNSWFHVNSVLESAHVLYADELRLEKHNILKQDLHSFVCKMLIFLSNFPADNDNKIVSNGIQPLPLTRIMRPRHITLV